MFHIIPLFWKTCLSPHFSHNPAFFLLHVFFAFYRVSLWGPEIISHDAISVWKKKEIKAALSLVFAPGEKNSISNHI